MLRQGQPAALREMALRRTAELVDGVREWSVEQSRGLRAWDRSGAILTWVGECRAPASDWLQTVGFGRSMAAPSESGYSKGNRAADRYT
jgi:hypothetical protein